MKKITLTLLQSLLLLAVSCDKDNDTPSPSPAPGPAPVITTNDTLAVGWSQQKIGDLALADVFFQDSLIGYVAGGSVYKTNNGGVTWVNVPDADGATNLFI